MQFANEPTCGEVFRPRWRLWWRYDTVAKWGRVGGFQPRLGGRGDGKVSRVETELARGSGEAPILAAQPRSPIAETSRAAKKHPRVADESPSQRPGFGKGFISFWY